MGIRPYVHFDFSAPSWIKTIGLDGGGRPDARHRKRRQEHMLNKMERRADRHMRAAREHKVRLPVRRRSEAAEVSGGQETSRRQSLCPSCTRRPSPPSGSNRSSCESRVSPSTRAPLIDLRARTAARCWARRPGFDRFFRMLRMRKGFPDRTDKA